MGRVVASAPRSSFGSHLFRFALGVVAATVLGSCADPIDTTRVAVDTGTFGATVYTLGCKRLAYEQDRTDGDGRTDVRGDDYRDFCRSGGAAPAETQAPLLALDAHRDALIAALDAAFPEDFLPRLQGLVSSNDFLALYDDGSLDAAVDGNIRLFELFAEDPDLAPALARLEGRYGYRPVLAALGSLRSVTAYDGMDDVLGAFIDSIAPGGAARGEFRKFQQAISHELVNLKPTTEMAKSDRTLRLALDLLLVESPLLGTERPMPLVLRDLRGLALPQKDATQKLPAPFVDVDGDGFADADVQGRFVDNVGMPVVVPTPFLTPHADDTAAARDDQGRALVAAKGATVYRYIDLDKTVLAALTRELPRLFGSDAPAGQGPALDVLRGASAILGERKTATWTYDDGSTLEYRGYATERSALLDMLQGYFLLLQDPNLPETLELSRRLVVDHESEASRLFSAIFEAAELGDAHPEAKLAADSALYDDLIPVVTQIVERDNGALAADLLKALERPEVKLLGPQLAKMMTSADRLSYGTTAPFPLVGKLGVKPVDRTKADSGYDRSVFQRILHLIADASGVKHCSKAGAKIEIVGVPAKTYSNACDLFQIDDLAVFYVQSIACAKDANGVCRTDDGHYMPKAQLTLDLGYLGSIANILNISIDNLIESQSKIDGFRQHPTPSALNRVLFVNPPGDFIVNTMSPAVCKDGDRFVDQHADSLQAFEIDNFYDHFRPVVQAFADHNAEKLLVDALVVLHRHWPTVKSVQHQSTNPTGKGYVKRSDAVSYEPLLAGVLTNTDLLAALVDTAPVVNAITNTSGRKTTRVLIDAVRYLFRPVAGLKNRAGLTTTMTNDGRAVTQLSPWNIIADGYRLKDVRLAEAGGEGEAWERSTFTLGTILARGERLAANGAGTQDDKWRFKNPRFRGVAASGLDFVAARVAAHRTAGDLANWSAVEMPTRLQEILSNPVFAGAADFILSLQATPQARAALEGLSGHLGAELDPTSFRNALTSAGDVAQMFLDDPDLVPVARTLGKAFDPEFNLLEPTLVFLQGARRADDDSVLAGFLRNLISESRPGEASIAEIIDAITEIHRVNPYTALDTPLEEADYRNIFGKMADFLRDEKRGLQRFVNIVKERHVR